MEKKKAKQKQNDVIPSASTHPQPVYIHNIIRIGYIIYKNIFFSPFLFCTDLISITITQKGKQILLWKLDSSFDFCIFPCLILLWLAFRFLNYTWCHLLSTSFGYTSLYIRSLFAPSILEEYKRSLRLKKRNIPLTTTTFLVYGNPESFYIQKEGNKFLLFSLMCPSCHGQNYFLKKILRASHRITSRIVNNPWAKQESSPLLSLSFFSAPVQTPTFT